MSRDELILDSDHDIYSNLHNIHHVKDNFFGVTYKNGNILRIYLAKISYKPNSIPIIKKIREIPDHISN